jgi:dTDP-4-dehydrorhamnose reductase
MRLLVIGASGMLGRDLMIAAKGSGHEVAGLDLPDLDITDAPATHAAVAAARPEVVVNCAAFVDVDGAEAEEARAMEVNGAGAGHVAGAAAAIGALTVQISTDYVFEGTGSQPWREDSLPNPKSAYGRSKLAGELAVMATGGPYAIARSAWLFGVHGKNFVATMLRLGAERDEVTVVDDQTGCPTYTGHLATALVEIAEQRLTGVVHVAGGGACTWWELASAAFERTGTECTVHRGSTAELGRPAPRPAYSVLASTRGDAPRLPAWQDGLDAYLLAARA